MRNNRYDLDRRAADESRAVQAVIAVLFVLGVASLLIFHADRSDTALPFATTSDDYLHAPASDPSLPDVRAAMRNAPDDVAQAPTF
jgi:hypothetical protein